MIINLIMSDNEQSQNLVKTSAKGEEDKNGEDKDEEDKCDPASGDKDCYYPSGSIRIFINDQMYYTLGLLFVSTFLGFMW